MKKKERPYAFFPSIKEIPLSFYEEESIKVVFSDLDNTLAPYYEPLPSQEIKDLVASYKKAGLKFYIASNNRNKRVALFAKELGVTYLSGLMKPFGFRLKRAMKRLGVNPSEACIVGDQIATDVKAGNRAGIKTIYVNPLVEKDPIWTIANRYFERKKRDEIASKGVKGVINYE